jgi:antitoxin component YwqK of YwqJK toxin-antitoxin module
METYFNDTFLLQNTLLQYFCEPDSLKSVNMKFSKLNYEKYLTYIQPHGTKETYFLETKIIKRRINYKNGKKDGLYEEWYPDGKLETRYSYKNEKMDGLYEYWYMDGKLWIKCNYKNGEHKGLYQLWSMYGDLMENKIM